eukprot:93927_1
MNPPNMNAAILLTQSQTSQTAFDLDQYEMNHQSNEETKSISDIPETTSDCDIFSDDDDADMPSLLQLTLSMQRMDEDLLFAKNGYKYLGKLSDILQGESLKAEVTKSSLPSINRGTFVAIKKTDKCLIQKGITIQDDMTYLIDKNAVKEAIILQQLTLLSHNNNIIGSHIIKFVDLFESETHLYLVTEYIENGITLKQFIKESHELIRKKKLLWKDYSKIVKYIMWQLISVIRYLHKDVLCCHLDVCLDNIILENAQFIKESYKINNEIQIKLVEFGFAELCSLANGDENKTKKAFEFVKHRLNIDNEYLVSPEIYKEEIYDCRKADIWSFAMIFYQCMIGKPLYGPKDMFDKPQNGYLAINNNQLTQYLKINSINSQLKYFNGSISLLTQLLIMDQNKRFNATQVVKHKYFKKYYQRIKKN